jgi:hypothetical protein
VRHHPQAYRIVMTSHTPAERQLIEGPWQDGVQNRLARETDLAEISTRQRMGRPWPRRQRSGLH